MSNAITELYPNHLAHVIYSRKRSTSQKYVVDHHAERAFVFTIIANCRDNTLVRLRMQSHQLGFVPMDEGFDE